MRASRVELDRHDSTLAELFDDDEPLVLLDYSLDLRDVVAAQHGEVGGNAPKVLVLARREHDLLVALRRAALAESRDVVHHPKPLGRLADPLIDRAMER